MKIKFILPLLASTVVIATIPFFTSCSNGESETDMMMDLYATNTHAQKTQCTRDEYFGSWEALPDKLSCVEYTLFSFILQPSFVVLEDTGIGLVNQKSLFDLCGGDSPIILPFFYTNSSKSWITVDGQEAHKYMITYIGQMAFEFQCAYAFSNGFECVKGDLLKFTLEFSNASFSKSELDDDSPNGSWLEKYNMFGIVGNIIGIAEIQSHGGPFGLSGIGNWTPYGNYFNYGY